MNTGSRPNQCSQCSGRARYTCPRCNVRTCSLACVQAHKDLTRCNGIRDKTAYVSIKDFTNLDLLSDYRLMEEVDRLTSNAFRNKDIKRHALVNHRDTLPHWLHRLRVEAKLRGTTLKLMPHVFTRRKQNSTCFVRRLNKILWTIEWQFPLAGVSFCDKRVDEDSTVGSVLNSYFEHTSKHHDVLLGRYGESPLQKLKVLLRAEDQSADVKRYYEITLNHTLKEALKKKTIVEFPILLVVPKDDAGSYDIIAEEPERAEEPKTVEPVAEKQPMESNT